MRLDGLYLDEDNARYAKPEQCLRIIRGGLTWTSKGLDVPRAVELRSGGELHAGIVYETEQGKEMRLPLEHAGTWEKTALVLLLAWNLPDRRARERLTLLPKGRFRDPPFVRPCGRTDDVLGFLLRSELSWRGTIELDGKRTEVSFDADQDANAFCARARRIVEKLRSGTLAEVKRRIAKDVYDEYADYMRDLERPALPSAQALANALRVDTIALGEHDATLWFGRVLGEHSILGIISDDCAQVTLDYP
jgi:hypothetical protein